MSGAYVRERLGVAGRCPPVIRSATLWLSRGDRVHGTHGVYGGLNFMVTYFPGRRQFFLF